MSAELMEFSNALAQATEASAAFAVAVHGEARGSASGVIWRTGFVVTAEHALRRDEDIHVTLPDGRVVPATLRGRDPSTDLAVLECPEAASAGVQLGDTSQLRPGSLTLVVGRTRVSGPVAALGVVSLLTAERRTWSGAALSPYIRLDLSLQPSASGGAVVDARGQIVGIATPRFARFGAVAIPAAMVSRVVDTLLLKGRIPRGYLGVGLQPIRLPEALRQSLQRQEKTAAIILEVEPDGPGHQAGLLMGDILLEIAGAPVAHLENIQAQLHAENIGKSVQLKIARGGAIQGLTLLVGERLQGGD
jgi:S1-C subfamily serine protease